MKYTLKNNALTAIIDTLGAEVKSIRERESGFEFMWQADETVWGRTAPVLFPVVGKLKENLLQVSGQSYPMSQHGFARDMEFYPVFVSDTSITLRLESDERTKHLYPFSFELLISYALSENSLTCLWHIHNSDPGTIYFSIGAHPGFNLRAPLEAYELHFNPAQTNTRHLLDEGLFNDRTEEVTIKDGVLPLSSELFLNDALVFKNLTAQKTILLHKHSGHRVEVTANGFPFLGIWTKKGQEGFLCIEPWFGLADNQKGHKDISEKEGIQKLEPDRHFERTYRMSFRL